ncbi:MAG: DUF58 domain-containing protein [Verrucomicrobiota bacterium]
MEKGKGSLIDPGALMRIGSMELRAKVVVEGFWHGLHRSPYHGFSVEFTEYRPYTRGDDTRYLDWKLFARSDRLYIKRFEDETNLRCHLVLDRSRSMGFGSSGYSKSEYAATLGATLARFLFTQGDAVGMATFDTDVDEYVPARNRPGHLQRLTHLLDRVPEGEGTEVEGPLQRVAELLQKRGLVVLLSDGLTEPETIGRALGYLKGGGHEVVLMQVLDKAEIEFDFEKATHFRDLESGEELFIDPEVMREGYCERMEAHLEAVKRECGAQGVEHVLVRTDVPLETVLFEFLSGRTREKKGGSLRRRVNVA